MKRIASGGLVVLLSVGALGTAAQPAEAASFTRYAKCKSGKGVLTVKRVTTSAQSKGKLVYSNTYTITTAPARFTTGIGPFKKKHHLTIAGVGMASGKILAADYRNGQTHRALKTKGDPSKQAVGATWARFVRNKEVATYTCAVSNRDFKKSKNPTPSPSPLPSPWR